MANDENGAGEALFAVMMVILVVSAITLAVIAVSTAGAVWGSGIALVNYVKAFQAKVAFEVPTP